MCYLLGALAMLVTEAVAILALGTLFAYRMDRSGRER